MGDGKPAAGLNLEGLNSELCGDSERFLPRVAVLHGVVESCAGLPAEVLATVRRALVGVADV